MINNSKQRYCKGTYSFKATVYLNKQCLKYINIQSSVNSLKRMEKEIILWRYFTLKTCSPFDAMVILNLMTRRSFWQSSEDILSNIFKYDISSFIHSNSYKTYTTVTLSYCALLNVIELQCQNTSQNANLHKKLWHNIELCFFLFLSKKNTMTTS